MIPVQLYLYWDFSQYRSTFGSGGVCVSGCISSTSHNSFMHQIDYTTSLCSSGGAISATLIRFDEASFTAEALAFPTKAL